MWNPNKYNNIWDKLYIIMKAEITLQWKKVLNKIVWITKAKYIIEDFIFNERI